MVSTGALMTREPEALSFIFQHMFQYLCILLGRLAVLLDNLLLLLESGVVVERLGIQFLDLLVDVETA